mmetsp:Transcript_13528/g.37371  ORF Transcript_13528/g.37371 Transcript_13528/m.37371 type:complete len:95 (+) Transcript_13528:93-377(+)
MSLRSVPGVGCRMTKTLLVLQHVVAPLAADHFLPALERLPSSRLRALLVLDLMADSNVRDVVVVAVVRIPITCQTFQICPLLPTRRNASDTERN